MTVRPVCRWVALATTLATVACSASTSGTITDQGLTSSQAQAFAGQIGRAMNNALQNTHVGPAKAPLLNVARGSSIAPVLINQQITARTNCTAGGYISVTGSMSGGIGDQTGSGMITIQITETISDWKCIGGYVINGDPYVSAAGTITFLSWQQSSPAQFDFGGGIKWGTGSAQSCSIHLSVIVNPNGTGNASGVVCGQQVTTSL